MSLNEQNKYESSPEEGGFERQLIAAAQIAKEAVIKLNIPEMTADSEFVNPRWNIFYQQETKDIVLSIQFQPSITSGMLHTSLGYITMSILKEVELLLTNSKAMRLLCIEESDLQSTIYDKTLSLTMDYISRLPAIIYHSFHQTVNEVLVSHIKKFVEYDLRDHWETLGYPKDYTLIPENNLGNLVNLFPEANLILIPYLETIEEEFSEYRKGAFSNRQAWLTPQVFAQLPNDYEQLLTQYKGAAKAYKDQEKAFFKVNRRALTDDWKKYWEEYSEEIFPNLFLSSEIQNFQPAQLTYRHLAQLLGFKPDYMEKIVGNARKQFKNISDHQKS